MAVLHRCDNPPCVNPTHLFLGTRADNNRDMNAKGRASGGRRKLDHAAVLAMVSSGMLRREIAAIFGATPAAVTRVVAKQRRRMEAQ
jgi:hypothetical protein